MQATQTTATSSQTAPFRILLIEDDLHVARLIQANVQKARMEFCHATYGEAGLALLEEKQPHLVLLDLMLPDMNGYDVCARIRQHSNGR
jgi:DNA-binding response OmpR family regulator